MATDRPASTAAKPPRSRLCTSNRQAPEPAYLFEALRELAFESCLEIAGTTLRIGLAASAWQLEQARKLLENFQTGRKPHPATETSSQERAVALALHVHPRQRGQRAQGVITLRRDNPAGLMLDERHRALLDEMRAKGARLVEVEELAFDRQLPREALIGPMVQALVSAVDAWGSTDILAECPQQDASFYCAQLGFKRLRRSTEALPGSLLLHLSARRIARLRLHEKQKPGIAGP